MSATGTYCINEVWRALQDTDLEHVVIEDVIRQVLMDTVSLVAGKVGIGSAWVSPALALTPVDREFTLPTSGDVQYASLVALRYTSDRRPLSKVSREWIMASQSGNAAAKQRQYEYAVRYGTSQEVEVSFGSYPLAAESVDALVEVVPSDWPQGAGAVPTIPFSRKAIKGTVLLTASAIFNRLGDDKRTSLDLGEDFGQATSDMGMALVQEAKLDVIRLKRSSNPDSYDWIATWCLS